MHARTNPFFVMIAVLALSAVVVAVSGPPLAAQIRPPKAKSKKTPPTEVVFKIPKEPKPEEPSVEIKTYDVGALLTQPLDRPLPELRPYGFARMGGLSAVIGSEEFMELIRVTVFPDTWEGHGGPGTLTMLGPTLVVRQFPHVHSVIAEVIDQLRSVTKRAVRLRADWLFLSSEQYRSLALSSLEQAATGKDVRPYDPTKLLDLIETVPGVHGEVLGRDGQTVHLQAGDRSLTAADTTPVISAQMVTHDVAVYFRHDGAALQITPKTLDDDKRIAIDVHSFVCLPNPRRGDTDLHLKGLVSTGDAGSSPFATTIGSVPIPVVTRDVARTTVTVTPGEPFLVSASTFNPRTDDGDLRVMCLILTAELP